VDIVKYYQGFVAWWKGHEKHFHQWDNDRNELLHPNGFPVAGRYFQLVLITHNKSTFYQNNEYKAK